MLLWVISVPIVDIMFINPLTIGYRHNMIYLHVSTIIPSVKLHISTYTNQLLDIGNVLGPPPCRNDGLERLPSIVDSICSFVWF